MTKTLSRLLIASLLALTLITTGFAGGAQAEAADDTAAVITANFIESYTLDDIATEIRGVYLISVEDADALSENAPSLFNKVDRCVYIVADQYVAGCPIPYPVTACYYIDPADGSVQIVPQYGITFWTDWREVYAGIAITDVTADVLGVSAD